MSKIDYITVNNGERYPVHRVYDGTDFDDRMDQAILNGHSFQPGTTGDNLVCITCGAELRKECNYQLDANNIICNPPKKKEDLLEGRLKEARSNGHTMRFLSNSSGFSKYECRHCLSTIMDGLYSESSADMVTCEETECYPY